VKGKLASLGWHAVNRLSKDVRLPFELRCRLDYWDWWGTWPPPRPVTVNQKIRWKMLKDRNPLLTTLADKVAARAYIAERVGPEVLTECYAVVEDPGDLDFDSLPREYVIKASHGSGGAWFVTEQAPTGGMLPTKTWDWSVTHPDETDREQLVAAARSWLASNWGREALEWCYLHIPPRLLVEEFLPWTDGGPIELKCWTFHGKVRMIRLVNRKFADLRLDALSPEWEHLDVLSDDTPALERPPERPESLDRVIEIAERLADGLDFLRVDTYDVGGGRIVCGELTNYPNAGYMQWKPASFDAELGAWWRLDY
jgi:TupA-like ATPgrasp